jgi:hypothetical protein
VKVPAPACPVAKSHCFTVSVLDGLGVDGFDVHVFVGLLLSVAVCLTSSFG